MKCIHPHSYGSALALFATVCLLATPRSDAAFVNYYIGVDNQSHLTSGVYNGLTNPNHNRLTFLYAHPNLTTPTSNHYHSKGIYRYSGSNLGEGLTATEVSPTNYLPEGVNPPLSLTLASGGVYDGKLTSTAQSGNSFSAQTIEDTGKLSGFAPDTGEAIMFNSSGGRWNRPITGADVHMELVSLSAGLHVGDSTTLNLFNVPGDDHHLDDSFSFTPTFWTEASTEPGIYTAQFKFTDESGLFAESGVVEYRFEIVPEPSSALLGALGAIALLRRRR